jgi:hypothetical protein
VGVLAADDVVSAMAQPGGTAAPDAAPTEGGRA